MDGYSIGHVQQWKVTKKSQKVHKSAGDASILSQIPISWSSSDEIKNGCESKLKKTIDHFAFSKEWLVLEVPFLGWFEKRF